MTANRTEATGVGLGSNVDAGAAVGVGAAVGRTVAEGSGDGVGEVGGSAAAEVQPVINKNTSKQAENGFMSVF